MFQGDPRLALEERVLRRSRSYKVALVGAALLGGVSLLSLIGCIILRETDCPAGYYFGSTLFWGAIVAYAQARLEHIATIRRHRSVGEATPPPIPEHRSRTLPPSGLAQWSARPSSEDDSVKSS